MVRTESRNTIQFCLKWGQEASLRLVTAGVPRSVLCKICGRQSGIGKGFAPSAACSHGQNLPTNVPYSSSPTSYSHHKYKRAKPGNLPKSKVVSEVLEHWVEDCQFFSYFMWLNVVDVLMWEEK